VEAWAEAELLPSVARISFKEDILLDCLIANDDSSSCESIADAKLFVKSALDSWVYVDDATVASGGIQRIAVRLYLYNVTGDAEEGSQLKKLITSTKELSISKIPLINLHHMENESYLDFTIPKYDKDDEGSNKVIAQLVSFACKLHSVKMDHCSFYEEESLGVGKVTIPSGLSKLVDALKASASLSTGVYSGEEYRFKSGYKGTLPCMLASMRLLTIKQEFLRKRKFPKDSGKTSVTFHELQQSFNTFAGFKSDENNSFALKMTKAILQSCLKPFNKGFPGGWVFSNRTVNNVKSDFALVNLLGWTEICPSNHKMLEVLFNTVDEDASITADGKRIVSKRTAVNITTDKRNFTHQEFRTAVALTLPRLSPVHKKLDLDGQMKADSLSVDKLSIIKNFKGVKEISLVDTLNESYNFKVSLRNPKSKTKEVHYKASRDRLLSASANLQLHDANGVEYDKFSSVPKNLQDFLRKKIQIPH
jgi:hypothetical protein